MAEVLPPVQPSVISLVTRPPRSGAKYIDTIYAIKVRFRKVLVLNQGE